MVDGLSYNHKNKDISFIKPKQNIPLFNLVKVLPAPENITYEHNILLSPIT